MTKVSLFRPAFASEPRTAPSRAPGFSLIPTVSAQPGLQGAFEEALHIAAHYRERHHAEYDSAE